MYIFTISHEQKDYDCNIAHVIVADLTEEVRELAKSKSQAEGTDIWDKAPIKKIGEYTGKKTYSHIVLTNCFHG